ncbi:MAG TPA: hypothetical protein PLZ10_15605 [Chitinophagaceae bacterium]|jgi:hypothetical protein|nr:hypothetical protein [Chitinophagaceae bacterium]
MKTITFSLCLLFSSIMLSAQTAMKTITVGHPFSISLPDYMSRTIGLNTNAALEYKNTVKDVFGFVIIDDKESLRLAEISFTSVEEFYEDFIKDFIEGEEKVNQSKPQVKQSGAIKFLEADLSYYDKDAKAEIYYLIGMVETSKAYYKVLSYCTLENKAKFKEDFRKILYSLKD